MGKTALISVSDKQGVEDFARALVEQFDFRILSTGGTAKVLRDAGIPITEVGEYTKFPEMMEGRVKTLHPKIHGGLLARRDKPEHMESAREHDISMIDMVVVNLYPFEETVAREGTTEEEAIENIDIGGPSMLRSAAKNHESVTVVCDPGDYPRVLESLKDENRLASLRKELAGKVFRRTAAYDAAISNYLREVRGEEGFPAQLLLAASKAMDLRYGENPHQAAALYGSFFDCFEQLQGKELSYNNIIDITAAGGLIEEFTEEPTLAILKHTNPCGVASSETLAEAWEKAFATDRQAPFGGIIIMNRELDAATAKAIGEIFCEVIIAPAFSEEARALFAKKKNLRLMIRKRSSAGEIPMEVKAVPGGYLVQEPDHAPMDRGAFQMVTRRQPSEAEWKSLLFGWNVVKHVKSNAIVYAGEGRTLGVGAGQMSRVDSSKLAIRKAAEAGLSLKPSVVCSDAFFPFPDGLIAAFEAGATAAIQPGGSVRDQEVIAAADERDMAMVFTGYRHFKHG